MRQAVQALIISGVLLSAAACGTATNPAPGEPGVGVGAASAPPAAQRSAEASARSACEALGQVYSRHMAPYAEALTKLVATREHAGDEKPDQQQVKKSLTAFATAISAVTQASTDPVMRADGKKAADQLAAKAADARTFSKIKTQQDVNTTLGPTLKQWLAPVDKHCS
ncbi:hypothetical protein Ani05nite_27930 [Amorphoplanes nipponensis]|uniref:Lipoprotein n=1 Tax=Actinoplanes nipponensis TaxID=135950 RepID=A0A919JDZ8_9ACTN|nr:hypothetical protein [Actinoplanes nipponensis]GIE49259.1 hypothetical protein Ani05nite_27930 [Actinoplanes nipponensis]